MYAESTTTRGGKVLVIDHCPESRATLRERLTAAGFDVVEAETGESGLRAVDEQDLDVVVLELHLHDLDGFTVLRAIRLQSHLPVLMRSGVDDETDRVLALEMGADDLVLHAVSPREVVARIRALFRRAHLATGRPVIQHRDLVIDAAARTVQLRGVPLALTPRSFDLLAFLAARPGRTFTRDELLQEVWRSEPEWQNAATVTEHIHRLRRQIEPNPDTPVHLITVRGNGYRFDP